MLDKLISGIIAFLLFFLMIITTIDVTGRYVFNLPLSGSTEITEFVLGLLIVVAWIKLSKNNDHISVDILEEKFSNGLKQVRDVVVQILSILGLLVLSYGIYLLAERAKRDSLESEYLGIPIAWFNYLSAFCILVSWVYSIQRVFNKARKEKNNINQNI